MKGQTVQGSLFQDMGYVETRVIWRRADFERPFSLLEAVSLWPLGPAALQVEIVEKWRV